MCKEFDYARRQDTGAHKSAKRADIPAQERAHFLRRRLPRHSVLSASLRYWISSMYLSPIGLSMPGLQDMCPVTVPDAPEADFYVKTIGELSIWNSYWTARKLPIPTIAHSQHQACALLYQRLWLDYAEPARWIAWAFSRFGVSTRKSQPLFVNAAISPKVYDAARTVFLDEKDAWCTKRQYATEAGLQGLRELQGIESRLYTQPEPRRTKLLNTTKKTWDARVAELIGKATHAAAIEQRDIDRKVQNGEYVW